MTQELSTLRNIAFVGHPSSGKTTLVDALAHELGASARKGSVAEKTSICDTEPEEQDGNFTDPQREDESHPTPLQSVHSSIS